VAHRRGGEVLYIYRSADRAFTCVKKRSDCIERGPMSKAMKRAFEKPTDSPDPSAY
jgi:hypothetical protein